MSEKISDLYSATLEMEDDSGNAKAIHDYFMKKGSRCYWYIRIIC